MYIAMNRFQVARGREQEFEAMWRGRPSHIAAVPGFLEFDLLKGPARDDHTLYASHTVWENEAAFEAWTKSEAFRAAHAGAKGAGGLTLGHPSFEGFAAIADLNVTANGAEAA